MSPRSRPDRPVPAVVKLRLRNAGDDAVDFIALSTTMLSAGLIHDEPRELRRSPRTPSVLELTCTFVDGQATRTWRRQAKVAKHLRDLSPRLAGVPRVERFRDVAFDDDAVATCRCRRPSWLVLDPPCLIEHGSPLICGDCHERLPSYRVPGELGCGSWAYVYDKVYSIWINSGVLETWAFAELRDATSALNRTSEKLAHRTARYFGVRVVPRVFTEGDQVACPGCSSMGKELGWRSLTLCQRCRIVY